MSTLYILCLDRHHLGDDLFLKSLAQQLADDGTGAPYTLLVHGSGEKVERTLEAQGYFPERREGVLEVDTPQQRRLVERGVREMNQEIVAALTDEVVATVGIQGIDRGLIRREEGRLRASNTGWLSALIRQHVVPVVSALVKGTGSGENEEVPTAEAVVALARALDASFDPVACLFTTGDRGGLPDENQGILEEVSPGQVLSDQVPGMEMLRRLSERGLPVLLTSPQRLFSDDSRRGTWVRTQSSGSQENPDS